MPSPLQNFSPNAGNFFSSGGGLNLNQQFTGANTAIDGLPAFADASNVGGAAGAISGGAGLTGNQILSGIAKAAKLGLQSFSFVNSLSAISDFKAAASANAARSRVVARERAEFETENIDVTAFRLLKRQTAQASAGGFAGGSQSTLALMNRVETDRDRAVTQVNKQLQDTLSEIQRRESEARKKARGLKVGAITGFATSILGTFSQG